jgi:hypothetical protein
MAAPAAAEAPVLAYLAVGLLFLLSWVVLRGLRAVWIHTFGAMLTMMADALNFDKWVVHIHVGAPFEAINRTVLNTLAVLAAKSEHGMGYFFHGAAVIQGWAARELLALASSVLAWSTWLQRSHLPRWVKALVYAAVPPALLLRLITAAIHANLPSLVHRLVAVVEHGVPHVIRRIVAATAGALALPGWVIHLPRRIRSLEREWHNVWRRIRKLEWYVTAAGAAALFTAALARLGLKWLRCSNVTKAGRAVCSTEGNLLESLLGDVLLVVGLVSVVEFAEGLQAIEGEAIAVMRGIVREIPG